jgi:hypothetical protein
VAVTEVEAPAVVAVAVDAVSVTHGSVSGL